MEEITASEVRARLAAGERAGRSFTLLDQLEIGRASCRERV